MPEEKLCGQTADIVRPVRKGGDAGEGHFTVLAVVKADDGDLIRHGDAFFAEIGNHPGCDLVIVADNRAAGGEQFLSDDEGSYP